MSPTAAITALDEYRLEHDYTWQELADDMASHGFPMSPRTLHHILKNRSGRSALRDRTLYKVQKFIETVTPNERTRRPA